MQTISDKIWNSSSSWHREVIVELPMVTKDGAVLAVPKRLRLRVECNAYTFQSGAVAQVWNDGWSEVHRIAGPMLKTSVSYVGPRPNPSAFQEDMDELMRVAKTVIYGTATAEKLA